MLEGCRILLVDDEEEFVLALAERLRLRKIDACTALCGDEALAFLDGEEPELIVMDLKMPGMDGIELLRRVKSRLPDVQVLMLTGHGAERDEMEARKLGACDYLEKPVNIKQLVERLERALELRKEALASRAGGG